ncbi:MAG: histidine phosphatase family protein [Hyphomicrobium sp.]|nr:histidine phosphatase family protein [Hyphomicrobium sp.]
MRTLVLLRHAKSSWDDATLDDFDRPLNARGRAAAPAMGAEMRRLALKPDCVLCSGATRTRETLALVMPYLDPEPGKIFYEDDLYLCPAGKLLDRIRRVPDACEVVLLVNHNPAMQTLALSLIGDGPADDIAGIARKFPTGALAVVTFEADRWSAIAVRGGKLRHYATPRGLSDDD